MKQNKLITRSKSIMYKDNKTKDKITDAESGFGSKSPRKPTGKSPRIGRGKSLRQTNQKKDNESDSDMSNVSDDTSKD